MVFLGSKKDLGKQVVLFQAAVLLSYVAAALNFYLAITVTQEDVSILYPIVIIIICTIEKSIGLIQFGGNQNIQARNFIILEIFYLSFLGFQTNACQQMVNCLLVKNFYFFLPTSFILAILLQKENLNSSTQTLCILIIIVLITVMLLQLFNRIKVKEQIFFQFLNYTLILESFLAVFLISFCDWNTIVTYILATLSFNLMQYLIVLKRLQNGFKIFRYEKINLFICSTLHFNHGTFQFISKSEQFKCFDCSQVQIVFYAFKSLALIVLMFVTEQFSLCYLTFILYLEKMQPHLNSIIQYQYSDQTLKNFENRLELLKFLKSQDPQKNIIIHQPYKKNNYSKNYIKLNEEKEQISEDFSLEKQIELLYILYGFYSRSKQISIQQYTIYVGEMCFVVEKCVSKQAIYQFLSLVKKIPEPYLQPIHYLAIDFQTVMMNRALGLQKIAPDQINYFYNYYIYQQIFQQLSPQALQINAFIKQISAYQITNPKQILYDLYS